jgi:hypothetical protein
VTLAQHRSRRNPALLLRDPIRTSKGPAVHLGEAPRESVRPSGPISSKAVWGQRQQKSDMPAKLQLVIALDLVMLWIGALALFLWHAHRLRNPIVDSCQFFLT